MTRITHAKEHKVAESLAKLVSDVTLDLERVGIKLSHTQDTIIINRLIIVLETAIEDRKVRHDRFYNQV